MRKVSIYALLDPRDELVFYVGSSFYPNMRTALHFGGSSGMRMLAIKMRKLQALGVVPTYKILAEVDADERVSAEGFWIKELQSAGHPLVNVWGKNPPALFGMPVAAPECGSGNFAISIGYDHMNKVNEIVNQTGAKKSDVIRALIDFALTNIE